MARVCVVIPAFNAEAFIGDTIQSALDQTLRDLDVVVVDDGSTDATHERVESFGPPVSLLRQQRGGPAKARNLGARTSRAEWIAFLDADDIWERDKLERQLAVAAEQHVPFVYTDRLNIGDRGALPEIQSTIQPLLDGDIFEALLQGNFITTSSVLIRRDVFDSAGCFSEDPSLPPAEDWDLWGRVAAVNRAGACRSCLVRYRHHLAGASRNVQRMNQARLRVVDRALKLPRGRALSWAKKRQIWSHTWATNGWDAARHGKPSTALSAYARSIASWPGRTQSYADIARLCLGRL